MPASLGTGEGAYRGVVGAAVLGRGLAVGCVGYPGQPGQGRSSGSRAVLTRAGREGAVSTDLTTGQTHCSRSRCAWCRHGPRFAGRAVFCCRFRAFSGRVRGVRVTRKVVQPKDPAAGHARWRPAAGHARWRPAAGHARILLSSYTFLSRSLVLCNIPYA